MQEIVTGASKAAAEAGSEGMRRVLHPQNAQHPHVSAFSYPEGNIVRPKPLLLRETYFCGSRCREDQLTPREIDHLNAITGSMSAREGRWTADIIGVGKNEQLHIVVPCKSIDDRMNLPSLELICLELAQGQAAVDPLSLAERVRALEAQLKAEPCRSGYRVNTGLPIAARPSFTRTMMSTPRCGPPAADADLSEVATRRMAHGSTATAAANRYPRQRPVQW